MLLSKTGVVIGFLSLCFSPMLAWAHATPVSYAPVAGATELTTPTSISVRFTERIEVGASSLTVFGPDGEEVNQGKGVLDENDKRVLSVPILDKGEGVYAISWQVVSVDDGHFTKGAYSFLVDGTGKVFEGNAEEGVEISYSSKLPEAILSFTNLLGESIFLALLLFILYIIRPLVRSGGITDELRISLQKVCTHLSVIAYILFVSGSVISFARKSSELAQLQGTPFMEGSLVYLGSSVGTFLALKVLAITLLCALIIFSRDKLFSVSKWTFVTALVLLTAVLSMQAYVSHSAASFFLPKFSIFVTFVHLVAKELIIGGSLLLLVLFFFFVKKNAMEQVTFCAKRFDVLVSIGLLFASISGVYISWLHLKHFENIATTEWGTRFVALLVATLIYGGFRLFHQFVVHRKLHHKFWQMVLSLSLVGEVAAGLIILFVSGYISLTTPPFSVEKYSFSESASSEGVVIEVDIHPYEHDSFRLVFTEMETGEAKEINALTVTATLEEKSIGPNVVETKKRAEGVYVIPRNALSPVGNWDLTIIAGQDDRYDAHATFNIDYPMVIEGSKSSDDVRVFDMFGVIFIIVGVLLAVFSFGLYLFAKKEEEKSTVVSYIATFKIFSSRQYILYCGVAIGVAVLFSGTFHILGQSTFEMQCKKDGFSWQQSFPTREFEAKSPNTVNGCTVHGGHYHIVDEKEYRFLMETL